MQVVGHRGGRHAKELLEVRECLFEEAQRLVILQVADVLAEDRVTALGKAEGVLQFAADGQQFGNGTPPGRASCGGVAARSPQQPLAAFEYPHHRVVRPHIDVAIVGEQRIGDPADALSRLAIVDHDGLFAEIAARHHQRIIGALRRTAGAGAEYTAA